ncbi:Asp-tRNA(Asn)/Glu-tRNA(Gln) amidotransferase subunit GatC [Candidatus Shapirobacteria bacterium]|nr:Asp-tRNA(Asn)/Glu-tRNA(Gln) amidotransferase subunit GatC [Candidatus Shapirobacteria bacterium]
MSSAITDHQFLHIAKLSRLEIKSEENFIKDQLSQAANYVDVLNELESVVKNLPPTYQVNHKINALREDMVIPSLPQSVALSQASKTSNGYFVTSATIKK